jgi:hypothetical protein
MGLLAFIINVGLFVKAKINLQNATDAAAYAGAAVQARQLTNMAYVNWEIRNTYKEWMFKYYVLGQTGQFGFKSNGQPHNLNQGSLSGTGTANFYLETPVQAGTPDFDKYNLPSICIHNASFSNICQIYFIPGIPRFPAVQVAGISDIHEGFVDQLVDQKNRDCTRRSILNFLSAVTWAYGSGASAASGSVSGVPGADLIAASRPGAWLQSMELGFRMRNLELIANRPPVNDINSSALANMTTDTDLNKIGYNERPIKAYMSAFRNLSGGVYKDKGEDEFINNFSLTELPPKAYVTGGIKTASNYLLPNTATHPGNGQPASTKYYVDLQAIPVNYATMFTNFVSTSNNSTTAGVLSDASCGQSRAALPVPGYLLGFTKNPRVITYYAVKAESKFIGLFFPVRDSAGFRLTAYSAAKPFGGRIGPKFFNYTDEGKSLSTRPNDKSGRSASMVIGVDIPGNFEIGMPIPSSPDFWLHDTSGIIGGIPSTTDKIFYSIPNIIYDADKIDDLNEQRPVGFDIITVKIRGSKDAAPDTSNSLGLFQKKQLSALKKSLGSVAAGANISSDEVTKAVFRARRPTKYEALNYLIPDFRMKISGTNTDLAPAPFIYRKEPFPPNATQVGYLYYVFAPLLGPKLLFDSSDKLQDELRIYLNTLRPSVDSYILALWNVSKSILTKASAGGSDKKLYVEGAKSIHKNAEGTSPAVSELVGATANSPSCAQDMASKFFHFFTAESTQCELIPLKALILEYVQRNVETPPSMKGTKQLYYEGLYYDEAAADNLKIKKEDALMSAYAPGAHYGGSSSDIPQATAPLGTAPSSVTVRNAYSVKFVQLAKLMDSVGGVEQGATVQGIKDYQTQPALREMLNEDSADLLSLGEILNPLEANNSGLTNSYFLEF